MSNSKQINVYVKPNAKVTKLVCIKENIYHIALHAKPKDGEANHELIRFLSTLFDTPKTSIKIIKGEHSRHKVVLIA